MDNDVIKSVREIKFNNEKIKPIVEGIPGEKTLKNFLKTAMMPVGTTLYVYGGGWNWQDNGSSVQARTIGLSSDWIMFFNNNDESYNYTKTTIHKEKYNEYYYAGLDCSGYIGWVIYNTIQKEDGLDGYVGSSTTTSKRLSELGWGIWSNNKKNISVKPGDIMSIDGHVWISLGTCEDGSILILHSTPSKSRINQPGGGVQLSAIYKNKDCEAYKLANKYMSKYYPEWYRRYEPIIKSSKLYMSFKSKKAGHFSWDTSKILKDPDKIKEMRPKEVLKILYK